MRNRAAPRSVPVWTICPSAALREGRSERPVSSVLGLLAVLEVPQPLVVDAIAPARTAPIGHRRVEPESGDDQEGVARIRVDHEPVPLTVLAPPHEPAGVHR